MIRTKTLVAYLAAAILMGPGADFAAAEPQVSPLPLPPAPIDWRDFVDDMEEGDHVVGEELCAAPDTAVSAPDSFVIT